MMKINVGLLNDIIDEGIKTEVTKLKMISNQIKGLNIPRDFEYSGKLKGCSGKIDKVASELSRVGNDLAEVVTKYQIAEKLNANMLRDIKKGIKHVAINSVIMANKDKEKMKKDFSNDLGTLEINNTVNTNIVAEKIENIEKTNSNNIKVENTTSGKEIQNLNKSLKNKQKDLIEDIIKGIPKDLDDIEKMRMIYLKLNQTIGYLNNLGQSTSSKTEKIKIGKDVFDLSKMNVSQILGGKWTKIYSELLKDAEINLNENSIKNSGKGTWVVGKLENGKIVITYELFDKNKKGFFITNEKELKELLAKYDMEKVLQIIDEKRENLDKEIDNKIGYNKNEAKELMNEFIKKYSLEDNSEISIKDKFNKFIKFINNKEFNIIDAFSILKIYTEKNNSNIFGKNMTIQNDSYINGKNIIDVATITGKDEQGKPYTYYMYSKNNSELIYTDDVGKIINGTANKNAEVKK